MASRTLLALAVLGLILESPLADHRWHEFSRSWECREAAVVNPGADGECLCWQILGKQLCSDGPTRKLESLEAAAKEASTKVAEHKKTMRTMKDSASVFEMFQLEMKSAQSEHSHQNASTAASNLKESVCSQTGFTFSDQNGMGNLRKFYTDYMKNSYTLEKIKQWVTGRNPDGSGYKSQYTVTYIDHPVWNDYKLWKPYDGKSCGVKYGYAAIPLGTQGNVYYQVYSKTMCTDNGRSFETKKTLARTIRVTGNAECVRDQSKCAAYHCAVYSIKAQCDKLWTARWEEIDASDKDPNWDSLEKAFGLQ